jgi:hypothetical protein
VIELEYYGGGSGVRRVGRQPPDGVDVYVGGTRHELRRQQPHSMEDYVVGSKQTLVRQDPDGIVEMEDLVSGSSSFRFKVRSYHDAVPYFFSWICFGLLGWNYHVGKRSFFYEN